MEIFMIIVILLLAIAVILGLVLLLLWAERSVNADNKRIDDKWREMEDAQKKDMPK